jgi:hypothetical protein
MQYILDLCQHRLSTADHAKNLHYNSKNILLRPCPPYVASKRTEQKSTASIITPIFCGCALLHDIM